MKVSTNIFLVSALFSSFFIFSVVLQQRNRLHWLFPFFLKTALENELLRCIIITRNDEEK